ncbi:UNKNOWN [Stylonychia lemnae]|uniref:Bet v1-like protein n=1 Tax=Stylonychia lemnae TaxID=5949 RepID=A0A078AFZ2_STYLE|nr:UNKNOWN [Stylonychia lemnae]|eukprot:CDW79803.1 UNKNOWN [Stylonychia lemnae]
MSTQAQKKGQEQHQKSANWPAQQKDTEMKQETSANVPKGQQIKQQQQMMQGEGTQQKKQHTQMMEQMKKGTQAKEGEQVFIPVSLYELESCILPVPIHKAWHILKHFKLQDIVPTYIKNSEFTNGQPGLIDSIVKVWFADGAVWEIRMVEFSEIKRSIAYEVLSTEPPHKASSIQGSINLKPVTKDEQTYVEWITEFSNDADVQIIEDQRFKKFDFFEDAKNALKNI